MKNSTLKKILIACSCAPIALLAQPTLTATGINPVIGDQFTTETAQYVNPGSPGANQTWNLAMTSQGASVSTGVAPSSTPYSGSFPSATVAFGTNPYVYYQTSSSAMQLDGVVSGAGVVITYSDNEDLLRFPVTYNNSYTDDWAATFTSASYMYYRTGSTAVTTDGWGTLTTPAGTFANVMRVHFVQTYQDSTNIMSQPYVISYVNDQYMWYLEGNHTPIAAVYNLTISTGSPVTGGFYISTVVSDVEEESGFSSLNVYPTLASEQVNFVYGLDQASDVTIAVYDATGKQAMNTQVMQSYAGENRTTISVAELPAGVYFATLTTAEGLPVTRQFVITR
jgi:hypothetical protein